MNKIWKRFTLAAVIAIAVVCLGVFAAACGEKNNNNGTYTTSVYFPDGTAVNGLTDGTGGVSADGSTHGTLVSVQWCLNVDGGACVSFPVDENGKATIDASKLPPLAEGQNYHIIVTGLPENYTFEDVYYESAPCDLTITLVAE